MIRPLLLALIPAVLFGCPDHPLSLQDEPGPTLVCQYPVDDSCAVPPLRSQAALTDYAGTGNGIVEAYIVLDSEYAEPETLRTGAAVRLLPDVPEFRYLWDRHRRLGARADTAWADSAGNVYRYECWFDGCDTLPEYDPWQPDLTTHGKYALPVDGTGKHRFTNVRYMTTSGCAASYLLDSEAVNFTDSLGLEHYGVPVGRVTFSASGETIVVALRVRALAWEP